MVLIGGDRRRKIILNSRADHESEKLSVALA